MNRIRHRCLAFLSIKRSHLEENKIGYFSHMKRAAVIGIRMIISGLLCLAHAALPFLFVDTASKTCQDIFEKSHKDLVQ